MSATEINESSRDLDYLAALERLLERVARRAASDGIPFSDEELVALCLPGSRLDAERFQPARLSSIRRLERRVDHVVRAATTTEGGVVVEGVGLPASWISDVGLLGELDDPPAILGLVEVAAAAQPLEVDPVSGTGLRVRRVGAMDDQRSAARASLAVSDEELAAEQRAWERYASEALPDSSEALLAAQLDEPDRPRTFRLRPRGRADRPT